MNTRVLQTLLALPGAQLARAANLIVGPADRNKVEAAQALANEVSRGTVTIDQVRQAVSGVIAQPPATIGTATVGLPQPTFQPPRPSTPQPDPRIDAAAQVAARAEQEALRTGAEVASIRTAVSQVTQTVAVLKTLAEASDRASATIWAGIKAEVEALRDAGPAINAEIATQVRAALAPLIAQATPQTAPSIVAAATAAPTGRQSALTLFGLDLSDAKGNPLMFATYTHPEAPAVDPCFIWSESIVRHLHIAATHGRNLWLGGPAGTGKTQTAQQFAARTGRMFRRFVFDRFSTRDDFLGATGLSNGSTVFEPGAVLAAYTTPGAVCLLDEVGMGQPGALSALNAFLERQAQVAYAGQVWHRAPGTIYLAASNDLTQGDPSGRYAGVQPMNVAFSERFSLVVPFRYLDAATEAEALTRHTGCTPALATHLVAAMGVLRSKVDSGDIIDAPSIRQMVAFIEAARVLPVAEAWRSAIAARQPAESEAALAAVYSACVDEALVSEESAL
jgi:MoxR-like ATPase